MSVPEPRFDVDYNLRGRPGERYAEAIREAIYRDRIEVKTDHLMLKTGNVYIEFEQKKYREGWKVLEPCKADPERTWQHRHLAVGCCPNESPETRPTHGVKVPVQALMAAAWSTLTEVA